MMTRAYSTCSMLAAALHTRGIKVLHARLVLPFNWVIFGRLLRTCSGSISEGRRTSYTLYVSAMVDLMQLLSINSLWF